VRGDTRFATASLSGSVPSQETRVVLAVGSGKKLVHISDAEPVDDCVDMHAGDPRFPFLRRIESVAGFEQARDEARCPPQILPSQQRGLCRTCTSRISEDPLEREPAVFDRSGCESDPGETVFHVHDGESHRHKRQAFEGAVLFGA